MGIQTLFDKTVDTQRLATVGSSHKETWHTNLSDLACHIQPLDGENVALSDGAFYQLFKLWCAIDTDIKIGDRVIDGDVTYTIKGVAIHDYGINQHVSASIVKGK